MPASSTSPRVHVPCCCTPLSSLFLSTNTTADFFSADSLSAAVYLSSGDLEAGSRCFADCFAASCTWGFCFDLRLRARSLSILSRSSTTTLSFSSSSISSTSSYWCSSSSRILTRDRNASNRPRNARPLPDTAAGMADPAGEALLRPAEPALAPSARARGPLRRFPLRLHLQLHLPTPVDLALP